MANSQHYADAPTVKLEDYIPVKMFRTVHRTEADLPGGITEIKVIIDIERPFAKKLSFRTSSGLPRLRPAPRCSRELLP